jgi:hypothetical protein
MKCVTSCTSMIFKETDGVYCDFYDKHLKLKYDTVNDNMFADRCDNCISDEQKVDNKEEHFKLIEVIQNQIHYLENLLGDFMYEIQEIIDSMRKKRNEEE